MLITSAGIKSSQPHPQGVRSIYSGQSCSASMSNEKAHFTVEKAACKEGPAVSKQRSSAISISRKPEYLVEVSYLLC